MGTIVVGMADLNTARSPDILTTLGLGSCVGVTLYDIRSKIGGLAHIMLPTSRGFEGQNMAKFADSALIELLNRMGRLGASRISLIAKVAGGAHMFSGKIDNDLMKIGERNVAACLTILNYLKIPIHAQDTGGSHGRTIVLHTETGALKIRTIGAGERII